MATIPLHDRHGRPSRPLSPTHHPQPWRRLPIYCRSQPGPTRGGDWGRSLERGARHQFVRLEGFEPPTLGSEDRCSIPLSYSRADVLDRHCCFGFRHVETRRHMVLPIVAKRIRKHSYQRPSSWCWIPWTLRFSREWRGTPDTAHRHRTRLSGPITQRREHPGRE